MRGPVAFAAIALAATVLVAPLGATAATQTSGTLPRGGVYILHSDPGVAQAAIELWFRAPAAGYGNDTIGVSQVAAAACATAPLVSGRTLVDLVHLLGGRFTINVYPDMVSIATTVPAQSAGRVVAAMTAAYFSPSLNAASLKTAQRDAAVLAVERKYSPDLLLHDALLAQLFTGGPAHYAPLPAGSEQTAKLTLDVVSQYAKRAFRSSTAILTLAGNIGQSETAMVTDGAAGAADPPIDSQVASDPQNVSMSGAVGGIGLGWTGPAIADSKAATAMDFINDYLFREDTGIVQRDLLRSGIDASVSGQFITLHNPGVMIVTISGDSAEVARGRVLDALAALARPLDQQTFAAAQQAFLYHIASDAQTPQSMADNLGWYAAQGDAQYAPGDSSQTYVGLAKTLDANYVAQIAQRYLRSAVVVRAVVPSKGSGT